MDVVVRTPHGDADVDVLAAPADATLADLLQTVTGQAAPSTARVDERTVPTSRRLRELRLVIGTLIDTRPQPAPMIETPDDVRIGVVQVAGRGAGSVVPFTPGRYRLGTGRRLHTPEMETAPVETTAFELTVGDDGSVVVSNHNNVDGSLGPYSPTLGTEPLSKDLKWETGNLNVAGRVFSLERPPNEPERREPSSPAGDGSVPFHREPGAPRPDRPLIVGAVRDAALAGGSLWQWRQDGPGAFEVPFGIHPDGSMKMTVDLQRHRGAALVGSDRFTSAAARALLVEICTMHGPADLGLAIASSDERIASWSWARWLPHIRSAGPNSAPELFSDAASLSTLASSLGTTVPLIDATPARPLSAGPIVDTTPPASWRPPATGAAKPRLTLLVIDDIALWSQRDSPLRGLLTNPPPELRVLALCVGLHEAPGMCTSLIEEMSPIEHLGTLLPSGGAPAHEASRAGLFGSLARLHLRVGRSPEVVENIRPALVEPTLAADVARALAPLDDIEANRALAPPTRIAAPTLAELLSTAELPPDDRKLPVSVGVRAAASPTSPSARRTIDIELANPVPTVIAVTDAEQHDRTVAAILLGAAARRTPEQLALLVVGHERPFWHGKLPHMAGWVSHHDAGDPSRLIHRVAHVLTEQRDLDVIILIEQAFGSPDFADDSTSALVAGLSELAASLPNVHVVVTTRDPLLVPESIRADAHSFVSFGPDGDGIVTRFGRSVGCIGVTTGKLPGETVASPTSFDAPKLLIRPAPRGGRAMTPLERRLARSTLDDLSHSDEGISPMAALARQIAGRLPDAGAASRRPALLPPPLPNSVTVSSLLASHTGDGIPLGLVDRPERAENEAYWWQPGSGGSLLVLGSPRSGMTTVLDLLITGIAARTSADDLHVYAIDALPQRRRALNALPHAANVLSPDDSLASAKLISGLHEQLKDRIDARRHDDLPDLLLLLSDVARIYRSLPDESRETLMRKLGDIAATGAAVGINVVAVATRLADVHELVRLTGDRLVGAVSESSDRTKLGAPSITPADRHTGRCWSTTSDRRVQLAEPPDSLEHEIAFLAPPDPTTRSPQAMILNEPT